MAVILSFIQNDDSVFALKLAQRLLYQLQVALASMPRSLAQFQSQRRQHTAAGESGMRENQWMEETVVQLLQPAADQHGFSDAVGSGQKHHSLQDGCLR